MRPRVIDDDDVPIQRNKKCFVRLGNEEVETMVTDDPTLVESWITNVVARNKYRLPDLLVGLKTELSPKNVKGCDRSVAILQLCVGKSCLIYQIHHAGIVPDKLKEFLENPVYSFCGVGITEDAAQLYNDYDLSVPDLIDNSLWAARELGKEELLWVGLKELVKLIIGEEMDKPKRVECSRWDNRNLSREQVAYACAEVYFSFEVGRRLSSWYH